MGIDYRYGYGVWMCGRSKAKEGAWALSDRKANAKLEPFVQIFISALKSVVASYPL